ncbi:HepT-like ribonuclease domain-containing protein [Actinomyces timonensis]
MIAHGYDSVDHRRVWSMLEHDIPPLIEVLEHLLPE